jgi:hypothetical protein
MPVPRARSTPRPADRSAPAFNSVTFTAGKLSAPLYAFVGVPYVYHLPPNLFTDVNAVTADEDIEIIAGAPSASVGLGVLTGTQGISTVFGLVTADANAPASVIIANCYGGVSTPQVSFLVTARDKAGNTATGTVCVGVSDSTTGGEFIYL